MMEYIEREAALKVLCDACGNAACPKGIIPRCSYYEKMQSIPAADVVPMSWMLEHTSGDYISREQAVENAIDQMRHSASETAMRERLLNLVAADVRPVVTCADCKYKKREVTDLFGNDAIQCITGLTHRRDWFCADGNKREES